MNHLCVEFYSFHMLTLFIYIQPSYRVVGVLMYMYVIVDLYDMFVLYFNPPIPMSTMRVIPINNYVREDKLGSAGISSRFVLSRFGYMNVLTRLHVHRLYQSTRLA